MVETALAGNENVDGVMPMLWTTHVPAMNTVDAARPSRT